MARTLNVRPLAEADIESAAHWYDDERPGLAARFLIDLDSTFARIRAQPLQFPAVDDDVRRALQHNFPSNSRLVMETGAVSLRGSASTLNERGVLVAGACNQRYLQLWSGAA